MPELEVLIPIRWVLLGEQSRLVVALVPSRLVVALEQPGSSRPVALVLRWFLPRIQRLLL